MSGKKKKKKTKAKASTVKPLAKTGKNPPKTAKPKSRKARPSLTNGKWVIVAPNGRPLNPTTGLQTDLGVDHLTDWLFDSSAAAKAEISENEPTSEETWANAQVVRAESLLTTDYEVGTDGGIKMTCRLQDEPCTPLYQAVTEQRRNWLETIKADKALIKDHDRESAAKRKQLVQDLAANEKGFQLFRRNVSKYG